MPFPGSAGPGLFPSHRISNNLTDSLPRSTLFDLHHLFGLEIPKLLDCFVINRKRNSIGIRFFKNPFPIYSEVTIISHHPGQRKYVTQSKCFFFFSSLNIFNHLVWCQSKEKSMNWLTCLRLGRKKERKTGFTIGGHSKTTKEKSVLNGVPTCDTFRGSVKSKWKSALRKEAQWTVSFPEGWGQSL